MDNLLRSSGEWRQRAPFQQHAGVIKSRNVLRMQHTRDMVGQRPIAEKEQKLSDDYRVDAMVDGRHTAPLRRGTTNFVTQPPGERFPIESRRKSMPGHGEFRHRWDSRCEDRPEAVAQKALASQGDIRHEHLGGSPFISQVAHRVAATPARRLVSSISRFIQRIHTNIQSFATYVERFCVGVVTRRARSPGGFGRMTERSRCDRSEEDVTHEIRCRHNHLCLVHPAAGAGRLSPVVMPLIRVGETPTLPAGASGAWRKFLKVPRPLNDQRLYGGRVENPTI